MGPSLIRRVFISALCGGALALISFSWDARYGLKALVDIVASGRSDAKVWYLAAYALCFAAWTLKGKAAALPTLKRTLAAAIGTFAALGIAGQLLFAVPLGLNPLAYHVAVDGNEMSSTQPTHTHVTKVPQALVLSWFGRQELSSYDPGTPFLNALPGWYAWTMLAAALAFLFAAFGLGARMKNDGIPAFRIAALGLASFGLLKVALDGGPFNGEFCFAALATWWAMPHNEKPSVEETRRVVALLFGFAAWCALLWHAGGMIPSLAAKAGAAAALYATFMAWEYGPRKKYLRWTGVAAAVSTALYLAGTLDGTKVYSYLNLPVNAGDKVFLLSPRPVENAPELKEAARDGNYVKYYFTANDPMDPRFRGDDTKGQKKERLMDAMKRYGLNPGYYPADVEGVTCMTQTNPAREYDVTLIDPPSLPAGSLAGGFVERASLYRVENQDEYAVYRYSVTPRPCTPDYMGAIVERLRQYGAKRFVMTPVIPDEEEALR